MKSERTHRGEVRSVYPLGRRPRRPPPHANTAAPPPVPTRTTSARYRTGAEAKSRPNSLPRDLVCLPAARVAVTNASAQRAYEHNAPNYRLYRYIRNAFVIDALLKRIILGCYFRNNNAKEKQTKLSDETTHAEIHESGRKGRGREGNQWRGPDQVGDRT